MVVGSNPAGPIAPGVPARSGPLIRPDDPAHDVANAEDAAHVAPPILEDSPVLLLDLLQHPPDIAANHVLPVPPLEGDGEEHVVAPLDDYVVVPEFDPIQIPALAVVERILHERLDGGEHRAQDVPVLLTLAPDAPGDVVEQDAALVDQEG